MSNVVTGTVAAFGGDDLWQENKTDSLPGLTIADLPNRAIALYPNEIDKQFKFINQWYNGVEWAVSGSVTTLSASVIHVAGAGYSDGASAAHTVIIGDGNGNNGITIQPGATGLGEFVVDRAGAVRGRLRYSNNSDIWFFNTAGTDRFQMSTTAFYPTTDGAITLGIDGTNRFGNVHTLTASIDGPISGSHWHKDFAHNQTGDGDLSYMPWYSNGPGGPSNLQSMQIAPANGKLKYLYGMTFTGPQTMSFELREGTAFGSGGTVKCSFTASIVDNASQPSLIDVESIMTGTNHFSKDTYIALTVSGGIDAAALGSCIFGATFILDYTSVP